MNFHHGKLIGSPDDSSLGFLRSDNARRYVRQLPQYPKQEFCARFPTMSIGAIDLLEKMLVFDPSKRITGLCQFLMVTFQKCFKQFCCKHTDICTLFWQLMKLYNIHTWHLSMTSMMNHLAQPHSALILNNHHIPKRTSKNLFGENH